MGQWKKGHFERSLRKEVGETRFYDEDFDKQIKTSRFDVEIGNQNQCTVFDNI